MTFYPINSSHASSTRDCTVNAFTDPPYSIHDIICNHLEKLRELEVSGRSTLFSVTKHLLPKEEDSSNKKIMKAFFTPITALTMGLTAIVDHTLKYTKNDCIEELGKDLERCNKASEELLELQSAALQYFHSKEYEKFKEDAKSHFADIDNQHNQAAHTLSTLKRKFYTTLEQVRTNLDCWLEKSSAALDSFTTIFSKSENPDISKLKKSIEKLQDSLLYSFKFNIDIISDCDVIKGRLSKIAKQMNPAIEEAFASKSKVFEKKIEYYMEKLSLVEKEIGDLKRHQACKESVEESVEFKTGPVKVTKTIQSKKQSKYDDYITELNSKKSEFQSSIKRTASSYIKFFKETRSLFASNYSAAIIQQNHNKLKNLLREAQIHLNKYEVNFPKQEKTVLKEEYDKVNRSINIKNLIQQCNFRHQYREELEKYRTSVSYNSNLIKKTEGKLNELQSLSKHSSLKKDYEQKLGENKVSLSYKNSKLEQRYSTLYKFKEELLKFQRRFETLELHIEETSQEKKYNRLYAQFDRNSKNLRTYTSINVSEICSEIDDFKIDSSLEYFFL